MISFSNCFVVDRKTSAHAGPTLVATFGERGLINLREEESLQGGGLAYLFIESGEVQDGMNNP
jgi:hypothetical protein